MSICSYFFVFLTIEYNKTDSLSSHFQRENVVTTLPRSVNSSFSCFRSVINLHARVLKAQSLTASSWLVSLPLAHLYLRVSLSLMGIRPSAQLCVRTCSNSNWSLFPSWSLLRDWALSTAFPPRPDSCLSHWADSISLNIGSIVTAAKAFYEFINPALCISRKFNIRKKYMRTECNRKMLNRSLTFAPFTPLQSHFPHDAPQPWGRREMIHQLKL